MSGGKEEVEVGENKQSQDFTSKVNIPKNKENARSGSTKNAGTDDDAEKQDGQVPSSSEHKDGDSDLQDKDTDHQERDSDETMTEELATADEIVKDKANRTKVARSVPPPLADWNRSQSFPQGDGQLNKQDR